MLNAKLMKGLNQNIDLECPSKMIVSFNCIKLWVSLFPQVLHLQIFHRMRIFSFACVKSFSFEMFTSFSSSTHLNNRKYPIMNKRRMSTLYYSFDTGVKETVLKTFFVLDFITKCIGKVEVA